MANTQATRVLAGMAMLIGVLAPRQALADAVDLPTLVVHVSNLQLVPARELAQAQKQAGAIYARIGVRLVWTDGASALAPADSLLHVDVVFPDAVSADHANPDPTVFGKAGHASRRAYIYYRRIRAYAARMHSDPERALAVVMAHELGHVLLPEYSHVAFGLMRATWPGRILDLPGFMPGQGEQIRTLLAAPR